MSWWSTALSTLGQVASDVASEAAKASVGMELLGEGHLLDAARGGAALPPGDLLRATVAIVLAHAAYHLGEELMSLPAGVAAHMVACSKAEAVVTWAVFDVEVRGSREAYVSFRGTKSYDDMLHDALVLPTPVLDGDVWVHAGSYVPVVAELDAIQAAVDAVPSPRELVFVGHSLGGARATAAVLHYRMLASGPRKGWAPPVPPVAVSFGAPPVIHSKSDDAVVDALVPSGTLFAFVGWRDPIPRSLGSHLHDDRCGDDAKAWKAMAADVLPSAVVSLSAVFTEYHVPHAVTVVAPSPPLGDGAVVVIPPPDVAAFLWLTKAGVALGMSDHRLAAYLEWVKEPTPRK